MKRRIDCRDDHNAVVVPTRPLKRKRSLGVGFALFDVLPPEMIAVVVNKLTRKDALSFRATSRRNSAVFLAHYQHLDRCVCGDGEQSCEDHLGAWAHVPYIATRIDLVSVASKKALDVFHSDAVRRNWIMRSWLNRAFSSYTPHTHNVRRAYELPKRPAIVLAMHDPKQAVVKCWDARMWTWTMNASSACAEVFTAKSTRGRQMRKNALVIDGKIIPATVLDSSVNSWQSIHGPETGVYFYQVLREPTNKTRLHCRSWVDDNDDNVVGDVRDLPTTGYSTKTLVVYDVTSKQIVLVHTAEAETHKTLRTGYMVVELPPVLQTMSRSQANAFVKQVHDTIVRAEVGKMKERVLADEGETATSRCFLTLVSGERVQRTTLITTSKTPDGIRVTTASAPPSFRVALTRQSKADVDFRINLQRRHISSAMKAIVNRESADRKRVACMAITRANESIDALPPRDSVQMARMTAEMIEHMIQPDVEDDRSHHNHHQVIRVCNTKDSMTSWWDELCLYLSDRWSKK
jgi:hypothetical protein